MPNKRLKLAGGDLLRERSVVPLAGHGLRPAALRRRAGGPQLKRDPLGSAIMNVVVESSWGRSVWVSGSRSSLDSPSSLGSHLLKGGGGTGMERPYWAHSSTLIRSVSLR